MRETDPGQSRRSGSLRARRQLQAEALALACHLNIPVKDCRNLALARREAASLISTDRRLNVLAKRVLP